MGPWASWDPGPHGTGVPLGPIAVPRDPRGEAHGTPPGILGPPGDPGGEGGDGGREGEWGE